MKLRYLILIAVIAALGGLAYYAYFPGRTPAGQPPLANFVQAGFDGQFHAASGEARLLVLLSPT